MTPRATAIQQAINNEKFESLDESFWNDYRSRNFFGMEEYKNITITSAFFRWYFSKAGQFIQTTYWFDDVSYNFLMTNFTPTLEDMESAIQYMFKDISNSVQYVSDARIWFYKAKNKPKMYLQFLWEKAKTYDEIEMNYYELTTDALKEVEDSDPAAYDEIVTYYKDYWYYGTSRKYNAQPEAIVYMIGKDEFMKSLVTKGIPSGREYHDALRRIMTFDEMIDAIKKQIDKLESNVNAAVLNFFNDENYNDDQLDALFEIMMSTNYIRPNQSSILKQFTSDQLKALPNLASEKLLVAKDGVENVLEAYLKQANMYNIWTTKNMYDNLQDVIFLREDEILKYVKLIDSEAFKEYPFGYITKDTFKLMNKHSNKRQRWDEKMNDFREILYRHQRSNINIDDFEYLVKQTGVSNEEIFKALNTLYLSESNYPNLIHIKTLVRLSKGLSI